MTTLSSETVHASTVAIDGHAVLIAGRPGSGKSDLALRLIDRGAVLVSDDYTILTRSGDGLVASAPETIRGRMEVRGVGLVEMPFESGVPVALIVTVDDTVPRMPAPNQSRTLAGFDLPLVALAAFEDSAPIKVELALKSLAIK
jgi:serine kinase of HPr protein (carbohydrate metabolism regulator)